MDFKTDKIAEFLDIFNGHKTKIRAFAGCQFLELYRDKDKPHIFFTYSFWEDETALENYRNSKLFVQVWSQTKLLFNNKPEAWSVDKVATLN